MEIGLEQPRDACDECHGYYLLWFDLDGESSLDERAGWLKTGFGKTCGGRFTKDLHAGEGVNW
jgi:hypothetical protein